MLMYSLIALGGAGRAP
jgi:hypothetical protein